MYNALLMITLALTCLCLCVYVQGDVRGTDSDASLTAFCLIAMQESRAICNSTVNVSTSPTYNVLFPPLFILYLISDFYPQHLQIVQL